MKVFLATFQGVWLGGDMIIVDKTKRKAFNKAKKELDKWGLQEKNKDFSIDSLQEIETNQESIILISNGDY